MSNEGVSYRSSGRVLGQNAKHLRNHQEGAHSRDDSLETAVAGGGRVTAARAATAIGSLTELDRQVIGSLESVRLASGRQLQRLHFGEGEAAARRAGRALKRLTDLRVLARLDRRVGGVRAGSAGYVYVLDVIGQIATGLTGRRPWPVGNAFVAHGLLVTDCLVSLRTTAPACGFSVTEFQAEPNCWQAFTSESGVSVLKPDALVETDNGEFEDRWWLEVDNNTESPSRVMGKARLYSQAYKLGITGQRVFPKVIWVCTTAARTQQLVRCRGSRNFPDVDHRYSSVDRGRFWLV